ncbi:MAG: hypothetical protein KAV87_41730 [Desulfobacteraceae bacterium]|nr:hypothetical protein [Desulfobacteraceae bacterium]
MTYRKKISVFNQSISLKISERFGKPVCEVLSQFLQKELYDYEIANSLQIQVKHVADLRRHCKLKRANTAKRHFREKYGPDAVEQFKQLATDPLCTLTSIAEYFEFSRSNASIAYYKLFGQSYSDLKKSKLGARAHDRLKARNSYKIADTAAKILERHGFKTTMVLNSIGRVELKLNNTQIKPMRLRRHTIGRLEYFSLNSGTNECDFILGIRDSKTAYVLPINVLPLGRVNIPTENRESKYRQYRNAWHLLTELQQEKIC